MTYESNLYYTKADKDSDGVYDCVEIVDCNVSVTSMEIPGEIDGLPVTDIDSCAFLNCSKLESITIPDSVMSIGCYTFGECKSLKSIVIPDSVTDIGEDAFYNCTSLESVTLSNNIQRIKTGVFNNCGFYQITIPDSVSIICGEAFRECQKLQRITFPYSVTGIWQNAFSDCTSLESITIENPECYLDWYSFDYNFDGTIYGYENSTAQAFAEDYGYDFALIGEEPDVTTTAVTTSAATTATSVSVSYVTATAATTTRATTTYPRASVSVSYVTSAAATTTRATTTYPMVSVSVSYVTSAAATTTRATTTYPRASVSVSYVTSAAATTRATTTYPLVSVSVSYVSVTETIIVTSQMAPQPSRIDLSAIESDPSLQYYCSDETEFYKDGIVVYDNFGDDITDVVEITFSATPEMVYDGTWTDYEIEFIVRYNGCEMVGLLPVTIRPRGDVNEDGVVDISDVALFMTYFLPSSSYKPNIKWSDYNNDGKIDVIDAYAIQKSLTTVDSDKSVYSPINRSSENGDTLKIANAEAVPGETVSLSIIADTSNQLTAIDSVISWSPGLIADSDADSNTSGITCSSVDDNYMALSIASPYAIEDGDIVYINFTVPEDAEPGTVYNIDFVGLDEVLISDGDITDSIGVSGGTITVSNNPYLSPGSMSLKIGESRMLSMKNYEGSVRWSSEDDSIASVSDSGLITANAIGSTEIYAETEDGTMYGCTVYVDVTAPALWLTNCKGIPGETVTMYVNVSAENNLESTDMVLTWDETELTAGNAYGVGEASVASASGEGYVTVVAYGTGAIADGAIAAIDFTIPDNAEPGSVYPIDISDVNVFAYYGGDNVAADTARLSGTIEVMKPEPKLSAGELTLNIGESRMLSMENYSGTIKWNSSNEDIVTVSDSGLVKAISKGIAEIYAEVVIDGEIWTYICTVTVLPENLTSPALWIPDYKCEPGETVRVAINVAADNGMSGVDFGFNFDDSLSYYGTYFPNMTGTVEDSNVPQIQISGYSYTSVNNGTVAYVELLVPDDAEPGTVYNINFSGLNSFTDGSGDEVNVSTVSLIGGTITVPVPVPELSESEILLKVGGSRALSLEKYNGTVTWSSDNEEVASVSEDGTVTGMSEGTAIISAVTEDGSIYNCNVSVVPDSVLYYELFDSDSDEINDSVIITGCDSSVTSVDIPAEIAGYPVTEIDGGAFGSCSDLISVTIPESIVSMSESAFDCCCSLTSISVSENNKNYSSADGVLFNKDKTELICCPMAISGEYTIPDSVVTIGDYAFEDCYYLTYITIPDSVKYIYYNAFNDCDDLTIIEIPDSVISIGNSAFNTCDSLTDINVSENNEYYSSVDGVLFNKERTELILCPMGKTGEYIIPDGVISIGDGAFYNCYNLTDIVIPDSVTTIGGEAFSCCYGLTDITIPDSVTLIDYDAFEYCESLETVEMSKNVTSIGSYAFNDCYNLTGITIPEGVTEIYNSTFYNCSSLTSIIIPDGVTYIGSGAFYNCDGLTSIKLPASVATIGENAFGNCDKLESITIENPECEIYNSGSTIYNDYDYENDDDYYIFTGTIYGAENSTAQTYAENYGRTFAVIGEDPDVTTTAVTTNNTTTKTTVTTSKTTSNSESEVSVTKITNVSVTAASSVYITSASDITSVSGILTSASKTSAVTVSSKYAGSASQTSASASKTTAVTVSSKYAESASQTSASASKTTVVSNSNKTDVISNAQTSSAVSVTSVSGVTTGSVTTPDVTETTSEDTVTLSKTELDMSVGDNVLLKLNGYSGEATWVSSNDKVVTVDSNGNVKAVGEGTATILVTYGENNEKSLSCIVTVEGGVVQTLKGDADGNGKVAASDAAYIAKLLATASIAGKTVSVEDYPNADYNNDGRISALDAALIAKWIAEQALKK